MEIKILGSGCKNCTKLYDNAKLALEDLNLEGTVTKVTDFVEIAKYRAMKMPALVVDDKVVSAGLVLSKDRIIDILNK